MMYNLYSVKDCLNGFSAPMYDLNDKTAIRNFAFSFSQPGLNKANARDFDLYRIGRFDTDTGKLYILEPECIKRGVEYLDV